MFSKKMITEYTENCYEQIQKLKKAISECDAVLIGAGAGLSTAAGFRYDGERFEKYFSDFHRKYGITDMYSGGFYPYKSLEEYWAWWSRQIFVNRYDVSVGKPYADLFSVVKNKEYFVITTNVDHQFQKAGFDKSRLFYTQGDYGLWQCSVPCCNITYDNEKQVRLMIEKQKDMKIPSELIPKCPVCGEPMTMNLRCDDRFAEDEGWYAAQERYSRFLDSFSKKKILFLELGVGLNTPVIIKYPFWQFTEKNPNAVYACVNRGEAFCPEEIKNRAILINGDIAEVLERIK